MGTLDLLRRAMCGDIEGTNTHKNGNVRSVAESNVENGTVLREVDLLTAEHGGGGLETEKTSTSFHTVPI